MKITFLGGGNMAAALIGGLLEKNLTAKDIQVVDISAVNCVTLEKKFGIRAVSDVDDEALKCDVLVLAVKPQQLREAVIPLAGRLDNALVISIAAGVRLTDIACWLGRYHNLVRCMPNMPALIGAGISGLYADISVSAEGRCYADEILSVVGHTVWVETEAQLDVVTALSGSGPAYVFYFIEALETAGQILGLKAEMARELTVGTALGAVQLLMQSDESATVLRKRVTSKGGTTEAALAMLAASGWSNALIEAVRAAALRSQNLGDEFGREETKC